ncbi:hypothetical protein BABINDRAFT_152449 [Babjeviella inositovora NRRL Y-12698]|uniref:Protein kinase domain-containing protein n=1 Tax=Babjeviella inositovora NRRL Y-12698 TaxID=984486 RepID=A0A1E3QMM9_9ASCO|nr:uncharacterized protein BABINDRAFT_152449 [Babjeviella inositovora NRRL Y-12698]ODQ78724.1 hypothetical protein BABINDRAFT_152449 [Babjeviella inositovora NRRL Y-12698]
MFDNLRAYIRHGKQAGDLNNRKAQASVAISHPLNPMGNFPNGIPLHTEFAAQDAYKTSLPVHETDSAHMDDATRVGSLGTVSSEPLLSPIEFKEKEHNYQAVATHIVQEENQDRQHKSKYPALQGKYQILGRMGEGAFSVVYRALDLALQTEVAIKIIDKQQMDRSQKQAVLKEVTIMRQLHHPNIVKFITFIDADDYYYIVQELVPGGEIFSPIVKYTYFSEDLARHVIIQVAQALQYLHENIGVVHRDLKPENLLFYPIPVKPLMNPIAKLRKSDDPYTKVDEGEFEPGVGGGGIGVVKLADFGLSKQVWYDNTGTPCGTVGYTAPEIVKDETYSMEVDMWALGCVLYTLLCGFPPFYDERIDQLTQKVLKGEYEFLRPWWDEISVEAKQCVQNLLCVDKTQRYTIVDLLNDPWIKCQGKQGFQLFRMPEKARNAVLAHLMADTVTANTPSARAMKDAFDISVAYYREQEEVPRLTLLDSMIEEDEDEPMNMTIPLEQQQNVPGGFDLSLSGATILERRNRKRAPILA